MVRPRVGRGISRTAQTTTHGSDLSSPYWRFTPVVTLVLLGIVAIRLQELFPWLAGLHPTITASIFGAALVFTRSARLLPEAVSRDPLFLCVALYYGWIVLTTPFALWPGGSIRAYGVFVPILLLVASFALVAPTSSNIRLLVTGFVAMVGITASALTVSDVTKGGRLSSEGAFDPNDLAALVAITFPLAVAAAMRERNRIRWIALIAIPLMLAALAATASRGGTLALAAGATVYVLIIGGRRRYALFAVTLIAAAALWLYGPPIFRERIATFANLGDDYNLSDYWGRKAIWERGLGYYLTNPLTGLGYGNFSVAEGMTMGRTGRRGRWLTAHNGYVQAFAELGTPGGLLFLALLIGGLRRAARLARAPRGRVTFPPRGRGPPLPGADRQAQPEYLASMAAFCTGALFLSHAYWWPLFGLLGLIHLADRTERVISPTAARIQPRPEWRMRQGTGEPLRLDHTRPGTPGTRHWRVHGQL